MVVFGVIVTMLVALASGDDIWAMASNASLEIRGDEVKPDPAIAVCLNDKYYLGPNRDRTCHIRSSDCDNAIDFVCNRVCFDHINQSGTTDKHPGVYTGFYGTCAANIRIPRGGFIDYVNCDKQFRNVVTTCVIPADKSNGGPLDGNGVGGGIANWYETGDNREFAIIDAGLPVFQIAELKCVHKIDG
ncbi:MAG: hypothetical protein M1833_000380 [Piccolia ochrophora]|nr:MAG: hypothetical protein M1833_000380 [Piccolia ochrophora]